LVISIYKLRLFAAVYGIELSVTQVCLGLEIVACLIRIVFLADPIAYYGILTVHVSSDLISLSSPFSLCGVLLIAIYWGNILDKVGSYSRASRWLQDRLKVYLIISGFIFGIMLLLVFYDLAQPVQGSASVGVVVIMAIVFVAVAFYFIINGVRVYKVMTHTPTSGSSKKNATATLITKYIASLGGSLLCVVIALGVISTVRSNNGAIFGTNWNLYLWMFAVSLVVVLTFQPPAALNSTSNSGANPMEDVPTVKSGASDKSDKDKSDKSPSVSPTMSRKSDAEPEAEQEVEMDSNEAAEV